MGMDSTPQRGWASLGWAGEAVVGVLLAGVGVAAGAESASDGRGEAGATPVYRAEGEIQIDGRLDEPVWGRSHETVVDRLLVRGGGQAEAPVAKVWLAWDPDYLYIGYETFDEYLQAAGQDAAQGPAGNRRMPVAIRPHELDLVEFFVVLRSERFFWEIHHNAANDFSDIFTGLPEKDWPITKTSLDTWGQLLLPGAVLRDDSWRRTTVARAVAMKPKADGQPSTVNDPSDSDTGYTGEIRIRWYALGTPKHRRTYVPTPPKREGGRPGKRPDVWNMAGQPLRMLTVVEQAEARHRYFHSSPEFQGGWFHRGVQDYNRYRLVDESGKETD